MQYNIIPNETRIACWIGHLLVRYVGESILAEIHSVDFLLLSKFPYISGYITCLLVAVREKSDHDYKGICNMVIMWCIHIIQQYSMNFKKV